VSDIEDENLLDIDTAEVPSNNAETPNTFGRNILRRLGIPHDHMAAAPHPLLIIQIFHKVSKFCAIVVCSMTMRPY